MDLVILKPDTFVENSMKKGRKETISIRIISASFVVLALAVFKPFGLDTWQWQAYVHLLALWFLGFVVCMITDIILKYVVRMPRRYDKGVSYIIRRNLWFQCINTPLVSLVICLYRHFVLNNSVEGNQFSLVNYMETLVIIGFCSFAIGLYWRFKFRSKFLAAELEETRLLNEKLKQLQMLESSSQTQLDESAALTQPLSEKENEHPQDKEPSDKVLVLTGTTNETVTVQIYYLLYIEAVGNYVKVCHLHDGQVRTNMLRATTKQIEETLSDYPMIVRCHRAFLVNLRQVEHIGAKSGCMQLHMKYCHDSIPVSRSNMAGVKEAIKNV